MLRSDPRHTQNQMRTHCRCDRPCVPCETIGEFAASSLWNRKMPNNWIATDLSLPALWRVDSCELSDYVIVYNAAKLRTQRIAVMRLRDSGSGLMWEDTEGRLTDLIEVTFGWKISERCPKEVRALIRASARSSAWRKRCRRCRTDPGYSSSTRRAAVGASLLPRRRPNVRSDGDAVTGCGKRSIPVAADPQSPANRLDFVAVRIQDEGTVVRGAVFRDAGRALRRRDRPKRSASLWK